MVAARSRLVAALETTAAALAAIGRVYQFYFNAFASNLMVTGGVQDQFRLLRSPTGGLPAFL